MSGLTSTVLNVVSVTALSLALLGPSLAQTEPPALPPAAENEAKPEDGAGRDPNWLDKLLAREAEPLEERPLASDDGRFKTRVAAEILAPPALLAGDYYVSLNVGGSSPMECWIYPEGHDMAASQRTLSETVFGFIASTQGEIETKMIQRIDAGVFGAHPSAGHPYLALDWLYRVETPQGSRAGQVKLLAAFKGKASAHCFHAQAGYGKTFERVFRGLIGGLEISGATGDPYYQEVLVTGMSGRRLGFTRQWLELDEAGNTKIERLTSLLMPAGQETLRASDTFSMQHSWPDGRLIKEFEIASVDGELTTQLKLDPAADGAWRVSGTYESRDYERSIEPWEVSSLLGEMLQLRRFLAGAKAGDRTSFWTWSADADPSTLMEVVVVVEERTADGVAAHLDLGPSEVDAILDGNGSVKSGAIDLGAYSLDLQRVYVEGALPDSR